MSVETQKHVKRRGWSILKWTWRIIYLSAIGGTVYAGYGIYQNKRPADQVQPDPSKKTLVVLGMITATVVLYQTEVQ